MLIVALAVLGGLGVPTAASARTHSAPDLPPSDRDTLARMFDPQLEPLGLRTTRAALQDLDTYDQSPTGRHLAIYVEPTADGEVDRAIYVRNIMKVARIFLPFVYDKWSDLQSFDVCQEPEPSTDPRPAPFPVTQVIATRKGAAALDWKHASLAALLKQSVAIKAKKGKVDPLTVYVSPRTSLEPAYEHAVKRAGLEQVPRLRLAPASTAVGSSVDVVEAVQELGGADHRRAEGASPRAEIAIGRDDHEVPRVGIGLDELDDAVVGSVSTAAPRVRDGDVVVDPFREIGERPAVEHQRDAVLGRRREPGKAVVESARRTGAVAPPTVGTRPDDVHAVDEEVRHSASLQRQLSSSRRATSVFGATVRYASSTTASTSSQSRSRSSRSPSQPRWPT